MCEKVYYESKKFAKDRAGVMKSKRGKKFNVYKCPECFGFHLTTNKCSRDKENIRKYKKSKKSFDKCSSVNILYM